jgi:hypothetical protein
MLYVALPYHIKQHDTLHDITQLHNKKKRTQITDQGTLD